MYFTYLVSFGSGFLLYWQEFEILNLGIFNFCALLSLSPSCIRGTCFLREKA
jgi:hypothetical protein